MSPRIGVLAVQGDVREHRAVIDRLGARSSVVRRPEHLDDLDGLIIPGGESTTIGMLIRRNELEHPVRDAIEAGMPVMGTCAGMILLSREILDGRPDQLHLDAIDMTVRRNAFGRQVESFEGDISMHQMDRPLHAVFIRAPWVERVGAGVQTLGTVRATDGTDRIVAVRQRQAMALSFHPEVTEDDRMHEYFLSMVEESR